MTFLVILIMLYLADPKWLGRHIADTHRWYLHYFNDPRTDPIRYAEIRRRAKNIRRIRNERFQNLK